MSEESKGAVFAAMGANAGIAVGKLVGGALTGSAAMFAEAGHSIADTVNQVFLLIGINLFPVLKGTPDELQQLVGAEVTIERIEPGDSVTL